MTIIEFFSALTYAHYFIMWGSIFFYLLFFTLSKNYFIASLGLLNYYGFIWLFLEFGFSLDYYLYMILPSFGIALAFSSLSAKGTTQSSLQRAILHAKGKKSIIENVFEGILVSGAAGSGKTQSVIYPILQHYAKYNFSGIIYDYKDFELTELAYGLYQEKKMDIPFHCICFHDISRTSRINPIAPSYIENEDQIIKFFQSIYDNTLGVGTKENTFFKSAAISAVSALTWKLKEEDPANCNLPFVVGLCTQKKTTELVDIISSNTRARGLGSVFLDAMDAKETISNIKASISSFLSFFLSPNKFFVLSEDEVDLRINDPKSRSILSIINSPKEEASYSPVLASIIAMAIKQMSHRDGLPSFLLLDEAPTLKLEHASRIPATLRSYKVSTLYCIQDKSLSDEMQGDTTTRAILSNLSSMYIGRTNEEKSSKMYAGFSTLIKENQISINQSSSWFNSKGENRINTSTREIGKIRAHEFFTFKTGEFYNFSKGKEQKLRFPSKEPLRLKPEIKKNISQKHLEGMYIAKLEACKKY